MEIQYQRRAHLTGVELPVEQAPATINRRELLSMITAGSLALSAGATLFGCGGGAGSKSAAVALESKTQTITARSGGTITLSDGSSVTVPPGGLSADAPVTLARFESLTQSPPNTSIVGVSPSVQVTFNVALQSKDISFVLNISQSDANSTAGSIPVARVSTPSGTVFVSLSGTITQATANVILPANVLQAFASNNIQPNQVEVALVNTTAHSASRSVSPYSTRYVAHRSSTPSPSGVIWNGQTWSPISNWNGQTWSPISAGTVDPTKKTIVLLGGFTSSAVKAFPNPSNLANTLGYEQVFGCNYDWSQPINVGGNQCAQFINSLGLNSVDIAGHSEGGVVGISMVGQLGLNVTIGKIFDFAVPHDGTPAAETAESIGTWVVNNPIGDILGPLIGPTAVSVVTAKVVPDLIPGSQALQDTFYAYNSRLQQPTVYVVAATKKDLAGLIVNFLAGITGASDDLVPEDSELDRGHAFAIAAIVVGSYPDLHQEVQYDPVVIDAINKLRIAPSGGFNGTYIGSFTVTNPLGTNAEAGTLTVSNGQVTNQGGSFTGTIGPNGQFTGTWTYSTGYEAVPMSGTFSTNSAFTLTGNIGGDVTATVTLDKE